MFTYTGVPAGLVLPIDEPPPGPPISVVSRKVHSASTFDINLFSGNPGVECRSGGVTNDYQVVFWFLGQTNFISAAVTAGTGSVSATSGPGTIITVYLTGVTNAQRITVTLQGVSGHGRHICNYGSAGW